jgi:NADH-quinone oxidoreductase subunit L
VSNAFITYAWLVPFLPLLGAAIAAVGARQLRQQAHVPVVAGIALAFVVSLGLLVSTDPDKTTIVSQWLDVGQLHVPVEFRVDGLTTMMLAMVTFVATLIAVFAAGYMAGDPAYPRFFALIGLFVFSMTGLVLSSNYVLTYAFWEGVGVCSYLLVGFWHSKPSAAAAAKKAFMVNRVGDFGFAVAIFWMWNVANNHDLSYENVLSASNLGVMPYEAIQGIALLFFWAATAKSAQIPLYVWLPDAMEGPTPVSALIHAATMVTAGVYLVARSAPMFAIVPLVQLLVSVVGCATALLAAAIALTQTDLKRVMAYSTVSQLGYMFMGLGAGIGDVARLAVVAAMFHLFTHAFFKALLFLASGSVMHSMGGVIDMRRFGGLRHRMPITCWTFAVGGLALSGIPIFAGFFSKDEILSALHLASRSSAHLGWGAVYALVYWVAVITAFLTAFYTGRAFFRTFFGPEKLPSPDDPEADPAADAGHGSSHADPGHGHGDELGGGHGHDEHLGHESPPVMTYPLIVLAVGAALVGLVFGPTGWFEHHLGHTFGFERLGHPEHGHGTDWLTMLVGTLAGVLGLGLSYVMYAQPSPIPARLAERLRPLYLASYNKFYVDEFYDRLVIGPTRAFAAVCAFLDTYLVDGLVRGTAWLPRLLGRYVLAPFQNGLVQFYAAATALGVAFLLVILLLTAF